MSGSDLAGRGQPRKNSRSVYEVKIATGARSLLSRLPVDRAANLPPQIGSPEKKWALIQAPDG